VCGIAGIFDRRAATDGEELAETVARMTAALSHRGPDDAGGWSDVDAGIALGHRRLAVLDLTEAGHQPMVSREGRYVLTYNGELYNFGQLRPALEREGVRFAGHGDTEVLLAGIEAWGLREMLERCNGMFAFALWDRRERTLTLVRDRLGEKPLYYGHVGGHVVFASELGAIRRHPRMHEAVDRDALAAYLRYGYVPAPRSILAGISKLGAGELLSIGADASERLAPTRWWSLAEVARAGREGRGAGRPARTGREERGATRRVRARKEGTDAQDGALQEELHELLGDAVRMRLAADVPLGALLSGGVDSSLVVALMQRHGAGRVRTFSVGFEDAAFDEAGHAARVAAHLGTEHTELRIGGAEALEMVGQLSGVCDEPFADAAAIPTTLIARVARAHVTVAFAGDGGDELFHGYPRYRWAERMEGLIGRVPARVRGALAAAAGHLPVEPVNRLGAALGAPAHELSGDRLLKLAEVAGGERRGGTADTGPHPSSSSASAFLSASASASLSASASPSTSASPYASASASLYERLVACWLQSPVLGAGDAVDPAFAMAAEILGEAEDGVARMALADSLSYLPEDILTKVDRTAMSVGLEARVPLLDHRVVELSWRMPAERMRAGGVDKRPLREILYGYVPRELVERPKRSFEVPLADWLRGPLRAWAQELLAPERLAAEGFFDVPVIMRHWHEHCSGRRNWHRRLWPVLMFQSWLEGTHV
jgi:asparagine synthase (glutamine-hydrolysing)